MKFRTSSKVVSIKKLIGKLVGIFKERELLLKRHAHLLLEKKHKDVGIVLGQQAALYYSQAREVNDNLRAIMALRQQTNGMDYSSDQATLNGFTRYLAGLHRFRSVFVRRCANDLYKSEDDEVGTILALYAALLAKQADELLLLAQTGQPPMQMSFSGKYFPSVLEEIITARLPALQPAMQSSRYNNNNNGSSNHNNNHSHKYYNEGVNNYHHHGNNNEAQGSISEYSPDDKTPPTNNFSYEEDEDDPATPMTHNIRKSVDESAQQPQQQSQPTAPMQRQMPRSKARRRGSSANIQPITITGAKNAKARRTLQSFIVLVAGAYEEEAVELYKALKGASKSTSVEVGEEAENVYKIEIKKMEGQSRLLKEQASQSDSLSSFMVYLSGLYQERQNLWEDTAKDLSSRSAIKSVLTSDAEILEEQGGDLFTKSKTTPSVEALCTLLVGFYKERASTFRALVTRRTKIKKDAYVVEMLKEHADILDECTEVLK